MEQRVSLITLGVADLARARDFYEAEGGRFILPMPSPMIVAPRSRDA